jgi:ADP-heptose:LPS heptosyltransferase
MQIAIIRQRPSIGDCLLLAPLVGQLKWKFPNSHVTVITDDSYLGGALPLIFQGIPGVDRVECINSFEWTTPPNQQIDPTLRGVATTPLPHTAKTANLVLDCNADFLYFEREHKKVPPYGIAEFWLRHHNLFNPAVKLLPHYTISGQSKTDVNLWLQEKNPSKTPMVGIVMRAGMSPRDWDYNGMSGKVADWLHTKGYLPVGIDSTKPLESPYAFSCVGKRIDFVAALLAQCKMILTPDTGLLHLAQAVNTPQVALWGIMPPRLRVKGYNCTVVPNESLGYCQTPEELKSCQCRWKFQQWSCLRRITLSMITNGLREVLA